MSEIKSFIREIIFKFLRLWHPDYIWMTDNALSDIDKIMCDFEAIEDFDSIPEASLEDLFSGKHKWEDDNPFVKT